MRLKKSTYFDFDVKSNEKDHKFKVDDHVRTLKCKSIFTKGCTTNWSEEVLSVVSSTLPWTYAVSDLSGGEIVGMFYEKKFQKKNQTEFIVEKVIKEKGGKSYIKWKGYDNSFNSWIDEEDMIQIYII